MIFESSTEQFQRQPWEGLLPKETNEEYHARKGYLSSSLLKERVANAYNFIASLNTPEEDKIESKALDFGSCAHEILLTNDFSQFVVMPEFKPITQKDFYKSGPRKGLEHDKVIKTITAQKEEFLEEYADKRIITAEQDRKLRAMMSYVKSKGDVMEFLNHPGTLFEQGYLYADPLTGEPCKFRADAINKEEGVILDYKTTEDASPYAFKKSIERYYYHLSAVHYIEGAERIYGTPFKFIFIAQEKSYPYKVALYELSIATLKNARAMRRELIKLIQKERTENHYPDYADKGITTLEVSGYAFEIGEART